MAQLTALDWMGNVREVENFAQQLCFWGDTPEGVEECIRQVSQSIQYQELDHTPPSSQSPPGHKPLRQALREFEASYLQAVLSETPDLHTAARELGISLRTLLKKRAEFGLERR